MEKEPYKPYSAKRWTEIPKPKVIGYTKFTPEEEEQYGRDLERLMREYGVLGEDERLEDEKVEK